MKINKYWWKFHTSYPKLSKGCTYAQNTNNDVRFL